MISMQCLKMSIFYFQFISNNISIFRAQLLPRCAHQPTHNTFLCTRTYNFFSFSNYWLLSLAFATYFASETLLLSSFFLLSVKTLVLAAGLPASSGRQYYSCRSRRSCRSTMFTPLPVMSVNGTILLINHTC